MFTEQTGPQQAGSPAIERWSAYLKELHARIAHRFSRPEVTESERIATLAGYSARSGARTPGRWPKPSGREDHEGSNTSLTTLIGMQMTSAMT